MDTKKRRVLVREILDDAPAMTSRRLLSKHLTAEMSKQHQFTYPNTFMRKADIDRWANNLEVPDRKGISLTLVLQQGA